MSEIIICRFLVGFFCSAFLVTLHLLKKAYKDRDKSADEAILANGRYWNMAKIIREDGGCVDPMHDIGIGDDADGQ